MINDYIVFCTDAGNSTAGDPFFISNQEELIPFFGVDCCSEEVSLSIQALSQGYRLSILRTDEEGNALAKGLALLAQQGLLDKIAVLYIAVPMESSRIELLLHFSRRHGFLIRTTEKVLYDLWSR